MSIVKNIGNMRTGSPEQRNAMKDYVHKIDDLLASHKQVDSETMEKYCNYIDQTESNRKEIITLGDVSASDYDEQDNMRRKYYEQEKKQCEYQKKNPPRCLGHSTNNPQPFYPDKNEFAPTREQRENLEQSQRNANAGKDYDWDRFKPKGYNPFATDEKDRYY